MAKAKSKRMTKNRQRPTHQKKRKNLKRVNTTSEWPLTIFDLTYSAPRAKKTFSQYDLLESSTASRMMLSRESEIANCHIKRT